MMSLLHTYYRKSDNITPGILISFQNFMESAFDYKPFLQKLELAQGSVTFDEILDELTLSRNDEVKGLAYDVQVMYGGLLTNEDDDFLFDDEDDDER